MKTIPKNQQHPIQEEDDNNAEPTASSRYTYQNTEAYIIQLHSQIDAMSLHEILQCLRCYPNLAKIRFYGGYPLMHAIRRRASLEVIQEIYEHFPLVLSQLWEESEGKITSPLAMACSGGAQDGVIEFIVEQYPLAARQTSTYRISQWHSRTAEVLPIRVLLGYDPIFDLTDDPDYHGFVPRYPDMLKASVSQVLALLDANPDAILPRTNPYGQEPDMRCAKDSQFPMSSYSCLFIAMECEQPLDVLELIVERMIATKAWNTFSLNHAAIFLANLCSLTHTNMAALSKLLPTLKSFSMTLNASEGCRNFLQDRLAPNHSLTELHLTIASIPTDQLPILETTLRDFLETNQCVEKLTFLDDAYNIATSDWFLRVLQEADQLPSSLHFLQIMEGQFVDMSLIHSLLTSHKAPSKVALNGIVRPDEFHGATGTRQPRSRAKNSSQDTTRVRTLIVNVMALSTEALASFASIFVQDNDNISMGHIEYFSLALQGPSCPDIVVHATEPATRLLQNDSLQHLDLTLWNLELDYRCLVEPLKTNTSLQSLFLHQENKPISIAKATMEQFEDIMENHNLTLAEILMSNVTTDLAKVGYLAALNCHGRKQVRDPSLTPADLVDLLCQAREDQAKSAQRCWNVFYGLLHECVGTWS